MSISASLTIVAITGIIAIVGIKVMPIMPSC